LVLSKKAFSGTASQCSFSAEKNRSTPALSSAFLARDWARCQAGAILLQQLAPCCRGLERRAALIAIVRYFFDPAVSEHHRKIARKRRGIERQQPAEFDAAHGPALVTATSRPSWLDFRPNGRNSSS
jgi:hypothetical protein